MASYTTCVGGKNIHVGLSNLSVYFIIDFSWLRSGRSLNWLLLQPTILVRIKRNNLPPYPQINVDVTRTPEPAILASLKWEEGWSKCSIYLVHDCTF